jgi:transposase
VIGDGAEWIWNIADDYFPGAVQIADIFHARQHLWDVARKLYPGQEAEQKRRMAIHQDELLDEDRIKDLVAVLRAIDSPPS